MLCLIDWIFTFWIENLNYFKKNKKIPIKFFYLISIKKYFQVKFINLDYFFSFGIYIF